MIKFNKSFLKIPAMLPLNLLNFLTHSLSPNLPIHAPSPRGAFLYETSHANEQKYLFFLLIRTLLATLDRTTNLISILPLTRRPSPLFLLYCVLSFTINNKSLVRKMEIKKNSFGTNNMYNNTIIIAISH